VRKANSLTFAKPTASHLFFGHLSLICLFFYDEKVQLPDSKISNLIWQALVPEMNGRVGASPGAVKRELQIKLNCVGLRPRRKLWVEEM
jgi:hypothetical protein